jgi:stage II sporulation protein D
MGNNTALLRENSQPSKKLTGSPYLCLYLYVLRSLLMRICGALLLALALVLPSAQQGRALAVLSQTIRVAIVKNAPAVVVDGDGLLARRENGDALLLSPPVTIRPADNGVSVNGVTHQRLSFAGSGNVVVNAKPYRGMVEASAGEKGILIVNELPLEEYLVGLINCEVSSVWPMEAVKAQAVIARTYALYRKKLRMKAPYHLESSVLDQVYNGSQIEDSRAKRAVTETDGEVLTYNGAIIQAFYHSNCGGKTEASENVWGVAIPYLRGVTCEYCLTTPSSVWSQDLELKGIEEKIRAAGFKVAAVSDIRPGPLDSRGRLRDVVVVSSRGDLTLLGDQFRKTIGYGVIKSTNFSVKIRDGVAHFTGLGNGHGVGLCQWGAKQRALAGFSYAEILSYYYPGTVLKQFRDVR